MQSLKFLYLRNFRNFAKVEISWSSGSNLIQGKNGQGKTNLLEAIVLLSTGRSFRTQHLTELIKEGETSFYLEAELLERGISQRIKMSFDGQMKQLQINGNRYSHFTPLLGLLPSVLYAPQGGELVAGSPILRRRFLDLHLAQNNPLYVHHLARFYRAMKQRNHLLRLRSVDAIEYWEAQMAEGAAYLYKERKQLVESLQPLLIREGGALSEGREVHQIAFHSSYPPESLDYLEQLKKHRKKDQEFKQTTIGPHRDDLSFSVDGRPARLFASEGQKRTTLAALKLAEWHHSATLNGEPPVFAIDDLGQPLDEKRQECFCQILKNLGQVFITTPKSLVISDGAHTIDVKNGTVADRQQQDDDKTESGMGKVVYRE